ncbi:MAG: phosphocholine cytidylyltransferase family protein [Deltaproteobacteria bacterium]|nr:phosphocholine cytidylyltransferase family protein [Deltaproteobacteria bacterium]
MKAVILAAGASSRLRPLTDEMPKGLLSIGGVPMLERSISALLGLGLEELVLVTGYLGDKVRAAVNAWFPGLRVHFVHNDEYATTNNAFSLRMTRPLVHGQEFFLLDSDIIFEPEVVGALMKSPHPDCLVLRPANDLTDEEIKVQVDPHGRVLQIGKHVPIPVSAGESVGIERFTAATSVVLFDTLDDRVGRRGFVREYYEASFQQMIDGGVELRAVDVGSLYCTEIDTLDDLAAAEKALAGANDRWASGSTRHGLT